MGSRARVRLSTSLVMLRRVHGTERFLHNGRLWTSRFVFSAILNAGQYSKGNTVQYPTVIKLNNREPGVVWEINLERKTEQECRSGNVGEDCLMETPFDWKWNTKTNLHCISILMLTCQKPLVVPREIWIIRIPCKVNIPERCETKWQWRIWIIFMIVL